MWLKGAIYHEAALKLFMKLLNISLQRGKASYIIVLQIYYTFLIGIEISFAITNILSDFGDSIKATQPALQLHKRLYAEIDSYQALHF